MYICGISAEEIVFGCGANCQLFLGELRMAIWSTLVIVDWDAVDRHFDCILNIVLVHLAAYRCYCKERCPTQKRFAYNRGLL